MVDGDTGMMFEDVSDGSPAMLRMLIRRKKLCDFIRKSMMIEGSYLKFIRNILKIQVISPQIRSSIWSRLQRKKWQT